MLFFLDRRQEETAVGAGRKRLVVELFIVVVVVVFVVVVKLLAVKLDFVVVELILGKVVEGLVDVLVLLVACLLYTSDAADE